MLSLEKSIRTGVVPNDAGLKLQSLRWMEMSNRLCPARNPMDIAGRGPLCIDSLYSKREGCQSALDRVNVENSQRPHYSAYNLNPDAISGATETEPPTNVKVNRYETSPTVDMKSNIDRNKNAIQASFGNVGSHVHYTTMIANSSF